MLPPALVTRLLAGQVTLTPWPSGPVPRKVDGKGLADLEPGFLSWRRGVRGKGATGYEEERMEVPLVPRYHHAN